MTRRIEHLDLFDLIKNHTKAGMDFVEKIGKFVKERCEIELRYASELRKLAKSYFPKEKEEEEQNFTFQKAFSGVVKETHDLAGQHELISEKLFECVYRELQSLHSQIKNESQKNLSKVRMVQGTLDEPKKALETSKKNYMKASEDSEQAHQAYQKADQDLTNSRLQLEKCKKTYMEAICSETSGQALLACKKAEKDLTNSMSQMEKCKGVSEEKGQARERAEKEYRNQVEKTNRRISHYRTEMRSVFDELQNMDEKRFQRTGKMLMEFADVQTEIMLIIDNCLDNIKWHGESVSGLQDTKLLWDKIETAYEPPKDVQFEEYGKSQALNRPTHSVEKKNKMSAGVFSRKTKTCHLAAALENRDAPQAPEEFSKPSKVQPPPAPAVDQQDRPPSAPVPPLSPDEESSDDELDEDVRCRVRVIHDFHATNDGELGICEGEELVVLEQDLDNSGWTKVLKGEDEGYVPSTYIEIL